MLLKPKFPFLGRDREAGMVDVRKERDCTLKVGEIVSCFRHQTRRIDKFGDKSDVGMKLGGIRFEDHKNHEG